MDEVLFRRLLGAAALLGLAFLLATLLPDPDPAGRGDDTVVAYDLRTGLPIGANRLPPVEHPPELRPEERLEPGQPVRIIDGPLQGLEGKIVRRGKEWSFFIEVDFLQRGASVEIDATCFRPLEGPLHIHS